MDLGTRKLECLMAIRSKVHHHASVAPSRISQDTGETLHGMPHHPIPCLAQVCMMKMGSLPPQHLRAHVLAWHLSMAHKGWVTIEMRLTRLVP